MTVPSGNGESRGPESASGPGTPLSGTRPQRAARNNAKNKEFLSWPADPKPQAGFGKEDFKSDKPSNYLGSPSVRVQDVVATVPDLRSMGQSGQTFGGS